MKVIVAGGRDMRNWELLCQTLNEKKDLIDEVVCGEAQGADIGGKNWAEENGIPVKSFFAQWDKYGRAAGPIRNKEMAEYADYLIAFWDGKSQGTKNMIEEMKKLGKHGIVVYYDNGK